jgi:hypothetical protein
MQDNLTTIITTPGAIITPVICSATEYVKPFLMRLRRKKRHDAGKGIDTLYFYRDRRESLEDSLDGSSFFIGKGTHLPLGVCLRGRRNVPDREKGDTPPLRGLSKGSEECPRSGKRGHTSP